MPNNKTARNDALKKEFYEAVWNELIMVKLTKSSIHHKGKS